MKEREGEIEEVNFLYTISNKRLLTHEMVELRAVMNHYVDYCHWVINIPWKKPLANHRGLHSNSYLSGRRPKKLMKKNPKRVDDICKQKLGHEKHVLVIQMFHILTVIFSRISFQSILIPQY